MRILIFGTGKVARDLLENKRIDVNYIEAFTETVSTKSQWYGKRVIAFEEIQNIDAYDMLIIALMRPDDIYKRCLEKKLNPDKICLLYPLNHNQNFDVDKNSDLLNMIFDGNTYEIVCNRFGIIVNDWIAKDELQYIQMNTHESMRVEENFRHYIYKDKYDKAGDTGSYFWQDLWAAKKIIRDHPKQHYDIGSRVDGFIAHLLAADIDFTLIDIRPLDLKLDGLTFVCDDATEMKHIPDESIESISALCSLEHFGLGRYGDPINPDACYQCFDSIQKKVKSGGNIYLSVPIGLEHLEFNAQRIFFAQTIVELFDSCILKEFSCANRVFEKDVPLNKYNEDINYGGIRFGLFWFEKK